MPFDFKQFSDTINPIITGLEDTTLALSIHDSISLLESELASVPEKISKYEVEIDKLKKSNYELLLRVTQTPNKPDQSETAELTQQEKIVKLIAEGIL